jgi:hypothetical protein
MLLLQLLLLFKLLLLAVVQLLLLELVQSLLETGSQLMKTLRALQYTLARHTMTAANWNQNLESNHRRASVIKVPIMSQTLPQSC